jgi:hypothetical protein
MARTLLLVFTLLLSAAWLQAQNSSSQSNPSQSASSSASSSGQTKVEGCLEGASGSYTLMSNTGTTYQLQGDTAKLSKHVGHEVEITGTTSGSSAASTGATSPSTGTSASNSGQQLTVEKVKHISATCSTKSK